ncbi:hypothetical protein IWX90DRAFT_236058 [Phyllosticta citrichinensis]|uniref:Uncharacterized protein n=1 Tax=Phyllosticta citrichinensis TaxID=1130410 RepID=A0ABR1XQ82_9PEZI
MNQMDSFNAPPFFNQQQLASSIASPAHAHQHSQSHSHSHSQSQPPPHFGQPQPQQQAHFQFHGAAALSTMPGAASMMQQSPRVSQSFTQGMPFAHLTRPTVSPPRHVSPYAATHQNHHLSTPEHSQPMAAPVSLPSHGAPNHQKVQTPTKPAQQPPSSPSTQARDHERISLLLDINKELLIEVMKFKEQGQKAAEGLKDPETKIYINDVMRRLQANLSYLATTYERKASLPGPAIMSVPSSPPFPAGLADMYTRLQNLFPGWTGAPLNPAAQQAQQQQHMRQHMQQQQQQQQMAQGSPQGQSYGSLG